LRFYLRSSELDLNPFFRPPFQPFLRFYADASVARKSSQSIGVWGRVSTLLEILLAYRYAWRRQPAVDPSLKKFQPFLRFYLLVFLVLVDF
jgi:hypothetical protein